MVKLEEVTNEKCFPRGGGSDNPKKQNSDFGAAKQGIKRKSAAPDQNDVKKVKEESSWISKVEANGFIDGLSGLGVVAEIFEDGVLLHTAGTHTVKIHAAEVSKKFTELFNAEKIEMKDAFQVGQMVPFRVISKKNSSEKGKVKGSCNPVRLNHHLSPNMLAAGLVIHTSVVSLEEKGAILDVGLDQITGFIEKSQFPASGLKEGMPLVVRILSTTSRVVKVTSFVEQDNLNMASCEKLQLNHLMPGTILECEPAGEAVTAGVIVSIGNGLKGVLLRRNLPPRLRENPEKLGKAIRAVVMFCQQNSKILVLNAHPDIVAVSRIEKRTSFEGISIGDKVKCTVIDAIPIISMVYFTLPPTDGKKSLVTAVSSRGLLEKPDSVAAEYEVGTEKLCRVVGYRYADRAITVSTRKDILNQKITRYQDAKCGDILDAKVHHVAKGGVYFTVCNFVKAFAPMSLLSDKPLTAPKLKSLFQVGTDVKCRVWQICDERKNLIVTCREQIIALKSASANNVEELEVGNTLPCLIIKVFPTGVVLLTTFNRITGVLRRESAAHLTGTPKVNDFVVANVEKIEENSRIVFVLRDGNKSTTTVQNSDKKLVQKPKPADSGVAAGKVYKGTLAAEKGGKANVTFTGNDKKEVFASVDDYLLSDLLDAPIGLTKRLLSENKEEVNRIIPMGKLAAINRACVKRSVARFVKGMKLPKKIEELKEDQVVIGVVGQIITNIGVFVELVGGCGLVGKIFERKNAKNISELLEVGQVIIGKIESIDSVKKSFLIDPCTEMENGERMLKQYALPLLESIVEEVKWLAEHSNYPTPGSKVDAKVTKELDDLTLVEFEHNGKKMAGVIPKKAGEKEKVEMTPKKKKKTTTSLIVVDINHATDEVVLAAPTSEEPRIVAIRRDYLCAVSTEGLFYLPTRLHPNHLPVSDPKVKLHLTIELNDQKSVGDGVFVATRGGGDVDDVARTTLIEKEFIGSVKKEKPTDGSEEGKKKSIKNFGVYTGTVLSASKFDEKQKRASLFVDIRLPGDNMGRLHVSEFPPNLLNAENPLQEFIERNANKKVVVRIIGFMKPSKSAAKIAELTMIPLKIQAGKVRASHLSYASNYTVGDLIKCFGAAALTDNQELRVEVNPLWVGSISRENLSSDLKKTAADGDIVDFTLERGEMRQAKVIAVDRKTKSLSLTLDASEAETAFEIGATVTGRVFFVSKTYIRMKLSSGQQAVLTPTAITEKYENFEDIVKKQLSMGKLVDVVCARIRDKPKRYFVVLKNRFNSKTENEKRQLLLDNALVKEGSQYDGIVETATKGSLFIELGPGITGRIPVNEENQEILEIGATSVVRVTVAKVNEDEILLKLDDILIRKWTVKLERKRNASKSEELPSKVALLEEEKSMETVEAEDPGFDWSNKGFRNEDLAAVGKLTSKNEEEEDSDDDVEDEDEEEEDASDEEEAEEEDVDDEEAEDEDEEEDSDDEEKVELIEKSEEEHSKLVRSDPNSAINWIEYMSLFVEKSDLAAARKTAEEALGAINPTESEELLKMWTAYLNMEVAYGESATVQEVFKRACRNANAYTVHKTLAKIYQKFEKNSEAKHILEEMVKKFRANQLEVWTLLAEHLMIQNDQKAARDLLPRALKSAPKAQQHIQLISKFANLEFKFGDSERGRTLLEGLVSAHPKKTDLWLVYADAALKHLGIEHARKVLERACNLDLTNHKMRPLYKKWLEIESKHGDAASIQLVKSKAEKFLQAVADNVLEEDEDN